MELGNFKWFSLIIRKLEERYFLGHQLEDVQEDLGKRQ